MNVGSRVQCILGCDGRFPITRWGKIIHVGKRPTVEFDWDIEGHDAYGKGKSGHCWTMDWDCIHDDNQSVMEYDGATNFIKKSKEEHMSDSKSRCLYEVVVVEPNSGEILFDKKIVAESKEDVILDCAVEIKEALKNLHRSDVDVIYHELGQVRSATTEKVVKLVAGIDGYKLVKEK